MNPTERRFKMAQWIGATKSAYAQAKEQVKSAADEQALTGIKDPTSKGTVSIPGFGDGADRAAQGNPTNMTNFGEANKEHWLHDVTKPNGVGQGSYPTPVDGDARDAAATSPTTPLDKIASETANLQAAIQNVMYGETKEAAAPAAAPEGETKEAAAAEPAKEAAPQAKEAAEKKVAATIELPVSFAQDANLMSKLASIGAIMVGTEEGRRATRIIMEKEAGYKEASTLVGMINDEMAKEAAAAYEAEMAKQASAQAPRQPGIPYAAFQKQAAANLAHDQWVGGLKSDFEKAAYAQGAADGEAVADQVDEGAAAPEVPGAGEEPSADDVIAYLQEMVASGQATQEEAEAILNALGDSANDGLTPEEFTKALMEAVQNGEIDEQQAEALAQAYIAQMGGGEGAAPAGGEVPAGEEEAAMAAAEQDPAAAAAAGEAVQKAASVISSLFTSK